MFQAVTFLASHCKSFMPASQLKLQSFLQALIRRGAREDYQVGFVFSLPYLLPSSALGSVS